MAGLTVRGGLPILKLPSGSLGAAAIAAQPYSSEVLILLLEIFTCTCLCFFCDSIRTYDCYLHLKRYLPLLSQNHRYRRFWDLLGYINIQLLFTALNRIAREYYRNWMCRYVLKYFPFRWSLVLSILLPWREERAADPHFLVSSLNILCLFDEWVNE